jgi:NADH-quinone oxidoreductase subunit M
VNGSFGILSAILWSPLLCAVSICLLPKTQIRAIQSIALLGSSVSFVLAWRLLGSFAPASGGLQFAEIVEWVPELGMTYRLALDGLSLPMVLLTTLITPACLIASLGLKEHIKAYFAWFMLLEFAVLGVFMAQDWFLFYMFWEITLVPMFFLIGVWGGERRGPASLSFFLYTLGGSVFMLLAIIAAYVNSPGHSFDFAALMQASSAWSTEFQIMLFAGFLLGVAVKIPAFPLHGWLPLAHVEAPVPVSMFLSAVLLKMGAYGLIRAGVLLPEGIEWFAPILFVIAMINITYGSLMSWRQTDLKAMVAFSSVSHMGFVLLGVSALTATGFTGAVMQMVTHGIITAGLFLLVGVIYERAHTRDLTEFSGLSRNMPVYAVFMSLALLASMGLPGLAGFISEFHALVGAYERFGLYSIIASVGILVTAAYTFRTIGRLFTGTFNPKWEHLKDMNAREMIPATVLAVLTVAIGIFPGPLLDLMKATLSVFAEAFPLP